MHYEVTEIFRLLGLAVAHNAVGNWAESDAALPELIDKHGKDSPYQVAEVYAATAVTPTRHSSGSSARTRSATRDCPTCARTRSCAVFATIRGGSRCS